MSLTQERDEARGYSIKYKRLVLAFAVELTVVATSLYGAWLFARMYGNGDEIATSMMMLAPIGYGLIELSRVPLAVSARTQRSAAIRALAALGVIAAAFVTVKSVSQLGEIMFRPRLFDVVKKHHVLIDAENTLDAINKGIVQAEVVVEQRIAELKDAEKHLSGANTQLGGLPPQKCHRVSGQRANGTHYTAMQCSNDPRTEVMKQNLQGAQAARDAASVKLEAARAARAQLSQEEADRRRNEAIMAYKDAVLHSQLHAFTGMAFGKDPTKVTDGEIAEFLRIFVFLPAICVSLASTLLAITSVEKLKPKEPAVVDLDEGAGAYILEPFAEKVIREATEAAEKAASYAVNKAHRTPELKVV